MIIIMTLKRRKSNWQSQSLFGLLLLFLSVQTHAQNCFQYKDGVDKLEQILKKRDYLNKPGFALAVIHGDSVIFSTANGLANITQGKVNNINTSFYIASIGKTFTSAAILLLRQEKKLNLDDRISKYINGLPQIMKDVRLYHLLTHTSGIADFYDSRGVQPGITNKVIMEFAKSQDSLAFEPGVDYAYSNTAYIMLASIIENISGKSYAEFITEKLLTPSGMTSTKIIDKPGVEITGKATGYSTDSTKKILVNDYSGYTTGSGGIYSTVTDLSKWIIALKNGKILNPRNSLLFWDFPTTLAGYISYMGMGWFNESFGPKTPDLNGLKVFAALGELNGFRTHLAYLPDQDFTFIVLCNSGKFEISYDEILKAFIKKSN